jgi:hypothetical protein
MVKNRMMIIDSTRIMIEWKILDVKINRMKIAHSYLGVVVYPKNE